MEVIGSRVRGPIALCFHGRFFEIGQYVAVRGKHHPEYYGVIVGFERVREGERADSRLIYLLLQTAKSSFGSNGSFPKRALCHRSVWKATPCHV
jgi:hypothetical protein